MADQSTIDVYAELYRRNAVPPEHKPVVDELVRRGVIKAGPKYGPGDKLDDGTVLDDQGLERGNILPIARDPNTNSLSLAVPGFIYHPFKQFEKSAQTGEITPVEALGMAGLAMAGNGAPRTIASPTRESWIWGPGVRRAEANAARAKEFEAAGVPAFAPALSDNAAMPANVLMGGVPGMALRRSAQNSIGGVEQGVRDIIAETGAVRPVNEIGTEAQDFLRRNLTRRSIPQDDIQGLTQFELQDISGIGPAGVVRQSPGRVPRVRVEQPLDDLPQLSGENRARNLSRAETEIAQNRADQAYRAELDQRRANAIPENIGGNSREPYMTEFDAAYEALRRNEPKVQYNPLGRPDDVGLTETTKVLDSIATDMRKQGLLPGYKSGQPFDEAGNVLPEVLALVDRYGGPGVSERIRALSDIRTRGAAQLSVDGLDKIRTAIGQALRDARQKPIPGGQMQGEGATQRARASFLSRLYDAFSQDVDQFVQKQIGGAEVAKQRQVLNSAYKTFMDDVRGPLEQVFGAKTTPEQAVRRLQNAARGGTDGDRRLLKAYFQVAEQKGDSIRASGVLLNSLTEGGLEGFLTSWRAMPPDVKAMMARGDGGRVVTRLNQLAQVGGYLERFADRARPVRSAGDAARMATNKENVLNALVAFINAPSAVALMAGQAAASQVMASKAFQSYLTKIPMARTPREREVYVLRAMQVAVTQLGLHPNAAREMAAQTME